ncbi:hypothetical protein [Nonomuraea angiospora]|uniref:hypothetical protein n=1 Tax=Nonomuraea angiospora TaxID=46172 RepID=UPI0029AABC82|nr:hypothetical protein [Nonomuraea angiospora]MDX3108779.1 hypothetical protein [Nonomuraea angiospora]
MIDNSHLSGDLSQDDEERRVEMSAEASDDAKIFQALGSIYFRETVPEDDIPEEERATLRRAWVPVGTVSRLVERLRSGGLAVIGGAPGMGKRSAAIRALIEYSDERAAAGAKPLKLKQLTPDWEREAPQASMLPTEANRGYLLDVSAEISEWSNPLETASALVARAARLRDERSCLILISNQSGWPLGTGTVTAPYVLASERPDPREIAMAHLEKIHDRPARVAWLQLADDGAPLGTCAHLITDDTAPADAAYLATLLAGATDDQDGIKAAIDAFQQWDAHLAKVFGGEGDKSVDNRALLIAAAFLGEAPALRIQSVARDLVGVSASSGNSDASHVRRILAGEELKTRFEVIGATPKGQNASLTGKPGLDNATVERVWTQRPDLQQPLLEWITRITAPKAEAEEHLQHIGRMLVRLAAAHSDVRLLRLVQKWVEAEGAATDRRPLVAAILNEAAQDPTLGPVVRDQLLKWAQLSLDLATTVALVCQMTFAEHYPRQALVRLQWILRRPQDDEAVRAAEEAVRLMAARPALLVKDVWPTITRWAVKDGMLSGRRAFLAMVDPRPSYSHLKELLAVADHKPEVRGTLLDAWRATLADETVDGEARAVLTAWAHGIVAGTLPESTTLDVLDQIVQHHLTASPVSALLYDTTVVEPEPHPGGLAHVRRLLWQRVYAPNPSHTLAES